jgi:oxygen-dependent protoporphyrinogen oxidase
MTGAARRPPVRIVGAGLSGLAAAWALTRRGRDVLVEEAGPGPGGLLTTSQRPEGLVESAARAFLWTDQVAALFAEAGVTPVFARDEAKRRYIYRDGRPRRWPLGPVETLSLGAHGLRALVTRQITPRGDESVAVWGGRVLGRAATTWLLAPALQGIYASPLSALSAAAILGGGRIRGRLATASGGMAELLAALVAALERRGATFRFGVKVDRLDPGVPTIVATAAPAAAALVRDHAPRVADVLARIRETSVLSVTVFYPPHRADLHGFGVLFPRDSGLDALGVLLNADMFPGRSTVRSETWIYGDPSAALMDARRADIAGSVAKDRERFTGRRDPPLACYPTSAPQRLPIYGPEVLEARARLADLPPWLTLCGNYAGKIGVSALVESAAGTAERADRAAASSEAPS